jgi:hypothetical protein
MTGVPKFTGTPTNPTSTLRDEVATADTTLVEPEPESQPTERPVLRRDPPRPGEQFGGGLVGQAGEVIVGLGEQIPTETETAEGVLVGGPDVARTKREQERETLRRQREQSARDYDVARGRLTEIAQTGGGRRTQAVADELRSFRITNVTDRVIGNIPPGASVRVAGTRTGAATSPGGRYELTQIVHSNEEGGGRNNISKSFLDTQIQEGNLIFQQLDP